MNSFHYHNGPGVEEISLILQIGNSRYLQSGKGPAHSADYLTLDSKFLTRPAMNSHLVMTVTDPLTAMALGRWKRVPPLEESLQPGAPSSGGEESVSSYRQAPAFHNAPHPHPVPRFATSKATPGPETPAGTVQRSSRPWAEGGANKRPFLRAATSRSWTAACGGADNPGACGRGRGSLSCQGDPGTGKAAPAPHRPDGQAGRGGCTMSCRKRSFTFGAYGG